MDAPVAAAAAISGPTRCVRPPLPWRPSKFRFEVLALSWPLGRTSGFIPRHMLQPASRHSNPASRNILSRPSFSAWALMRMEPGTTRALLRVFEVFLPAATCAARRRSSMRELVQDHGNVFEIADIRHFHFNLGHCFKPWEMRAKGEWSKIRSASGSAFRDRRDRGRSPRRPSWRGAIATPPVAFSAATATKLRSTSKNSRSLRR